MEISFTDLGRLIELWAAWYSIGVDGWLFSDESTHTCSLDLPNPASANGKPISQPPYPSDPALDLVLLHAINEFGLQCSRLGTISFSRTGSGEQIAYVAEPVIALLEAGQTFFAGKRLSIFSELRREYGDFGSHTMVLDLAVQQGQVLIHRSSFEMNNRRRGLKLDLWESLTHALATCEDIYEQGAAWATALPATLTTSPTWRRPPKLPMPVTPITLKQPQMRPQAISHFSKARQITVLQRRAFLFPVSTQRKPAIWHAFPTR